MRQEDYELFDPRKPEEIASVMAVDGTGNGNCSMRIIFILTFALSMIVGAGATTANSLVAQSPSTDLTTLFDMGNLVLDTNGDGVPDLVNASLVLGESPTLTAVSYTHLRAHET